MAEKLKPCPFCGGEARLVVCDSEGNVHDESYEADPYSGLSYAIVHGSDDCCGECPVSTSDLLPWLYETREEATAAWNRRAERTCGEWRGDPRQDAIGHAAAHEGDELWCEHCDIELDEDWSYCPHCGARVVDE